MKQKDDTDERSPNPRAKKCYEKPAFEREKLFETMALSCGKVGGTQESCEHVRKFS